MKDAYYHKPIRHEVKYKTGIITSFGTYQYERLPFGLAGSPSTFMKIIDRVLLGLVNIVCLIFMDDILIFSHDIQEHADRLRNVFDRLRKAKLTLNLLKCHFAEGKVEYLGHTVTREGVRPSEDKVKAIRSFIRPSTVKDVRLFLGLSGYYRRYILRYAEKGRPLTQLKKKNIKFHWTEDQERAFQQLKRRD
jgi:hypothetical protein